LSGIDLETYTKSDVCVETADDEVFDTGQNTDSKQPLDDYAFTETSTATHSNVECELSTVHISFSSKENVPVSDNVQRKKLNTEEIYVGLHQPISPLECRTANESIHWIADAGVGTIGASRSMIQKQNEYKQCENFAIRNKERRTGGFRIPDLLNV
jgi:hypothetical protein